MLFRIRQSIYVRMFFTTWFIVQIADDTFAFQMYIYTNLQEIKVKLQHKHGFEHSTTENSTRVSRGSQK